MPISVNSDDEDVKPTFSKPVKRQKQTTLNQYRTAVTVDDTSDDDIKPAAQRLVDSIPAGDVKPDHVNLNLPPGSSQVSRLAVNPPINPSVSQDVKPTLGQDIKPDNNSLALPPAPPGWDGHCKLSLIILAKKH
jgi:hypothetical protein